MRALVWELAETTTARTFMRGPPCVILTETTPRPPCVKDF